MDPRAGDLDQDVVPAAPSVKLSVTVSVPLVTGVAKFGESIAVTLIARTLTVDLHEKE